MVVKYFSISIAVSISSCCWRHLVIGSLGSSPRNNFFRGKRKVIRGYFSPRTSLQPRQREKSEAFMHSGYNITLNSISTCCWHPYPRDFLYSRELLGRDLVLSVSLGGGKCVLQLAWDNNNHNLPRWGRSETFVLQLVSDSVFLGVLYFILLLTSITSLGLYHYNFIICM